jgi:hypothetical protein
MGALMFHCSTLRKLDPVTTARIFVDFLESESKRHNRVDYFALLTGTKTPDLAH